MSAQKEQYFDMDDQVESWQHRIRALAPDIRAAEIAVFEAEAELKKRQAQLELEALAAGITTLGGQKQYAESTGALFTARLVYGTAKGALAAKKIELKSVEVGFDEWRTRMANAREERKKYGA